ncbi:UBA/TS-N domain-containing protein [Colletotrichum higginsianum]|uniref:UBA/TS-N domain-containing protein n=2 Tax=Colletotrichum higginsianum TaxID=80884 RepID=H1VSZ4_COLHI|nr:UBA domain-containing protein 3 [Colletotrichum higginsianum]CCF43352.1 UBA/TS-N domain-containing protein [Colletotrichum higginsianum]
MAGVLSKRQQARNEKVLHDLVQSVPGNNFCADCQARNPAWASWSLGVFLCMRCAAIHRKLGTHISKVKSLSMDSWSNEQVENMKKVGNVRSNQIYNQDNKKPPVPVDADEADSAMERFIRTKYVNNKPVPVRKQHSSLSDEGIPPPLPPKSGGKFGFRSASSIFPLSSRLKKDSSLRSTMSSPRDMPRSPSPTDLPNKPSKVFGASVSYEQEDTERKLVSLRDMGFSDGQRNAMVLKGVSGNLERAIETLVRLGESDRRSPSLTGPRESSLRGSRSHANLSASSGLSAPQPTFSDHTQSPSTASSNNPFDMLPPQPQSSQSTGTLQNKNPYANNPFGAPTQQQQDVNQAFGNLSLAPAQPLFPHHTGGLPASQPFAQPQQMYHQSMTPPVPQQQQSYNPMSFNNSNMTYPQPIQPQATGYNPFFTNQMQPQLQQNLGVNTAPTSSPFANNPFTRSPTRIQSPSLGQIPEQSQTSFYTDSPQTASPQTSNPFFAQRGSQLPQPPPQQSYQQQFQQEQNPFQQQGQQHFQPQGQQHFQQGQPLFQQQETGQHQYQAPAPQPAYQQPQRPDKASILALYNYPQLAPQTFAAHAQPQEAAQTETAAPRQPDHDTNGSMQTAGNKNPFLANGTTSPAVAPVQGIGTEVGPRKPGVSRESMAFTDMQWTNGRHSPDAFASLSARHM